MPLPPQIASRHKTTAHPIPEGPLVYNFVIPYRDRPRCLNIFLDHFPQYLATQPYLTHYNLLIVEQIGDKPFNLGKLVNVGYTLYQNGIHPGYSKPSPLDPFIWQPVDALPHHNNTHYEFQPNQDCIYFCDSQYQKDHPRFAGFTNRAFQAINGYANNFWGWGHADENLMQRATRKKLRQHYHNAQPYIYLHPHGDATQNPDFEAGSTLLSQYRTRPDLNASDGLSNLQYELVKCRPIAPNTLFTMVEI